MANDGRAKKEFEKAKLEHFGCFVEWDALPEAQQNKEYEDYIRQMGPGRAVQAFHEYEIWKKGRKCI